MKSMTIQQRLNTVLLLLTALLLAAVGLALWVEESRSSADKRCEDLSTGYDQIRINVLLMGDTLRNLTVNPKSELDKRRQRDATDELREKISAIQTFAWDFP